MSKKPTKESTKEPWYKTEPTRSLLIGFAVTIILGSADLVFRAMLGVPELKQQISTLETTIKTLEEQNSQKQTQIQILETQLTPFRTVAIQKYTGDENQRLAQLAAAIKAIDLELSFNKEFSAVGHMDSVGRSIIPGTSIVANKDSPLFTILEGTWHMEGNRVIVDLTPENEIKFRQAIEMEPKYPFAYSYVAMCLKMKNDPAWKEYGNKAIELFEKTIQIPGHPDNHEVTLEATRKLFQ